MTGPPLRANQGRSAQPNAGPSLWAVAVVALAIVGCRVGYDELDPEVIATTGGTMNSAGASSAGGTGGASSVAIGGNSALGDATGGVSSTESTGGNSAAGGATGGVSSTQSIGGNSAIGGATGGVSSTESTGGNSAAGGASGGVSSTQSTGGNSAIGGATGGVSSTESTGGSSGGTAGVTSISGTGGSSGTGGGDGDGDSGSAPQSCPAPASGARVWSFDESVESWVFQGTAGTLDWTGLTGSPTIGALVFDTSSAASARTRLVENLGDLTGKTVSVNVMLESGNGVTAKPFLQTGANMVWGDPGSVPLPVGFWTCVTFDVDYPSYAGINWNPKDVRSMGVQFLGTGTIRVYVDEVSF